MNNALRDDPYAQMHVGVPSLLGNVKYFATCVTDLVQKCCVCKCIVCSRMAKINLLNAYYTCRRVCEPA